MSERHSDSGEEYRCLMRIMEAESVLAKSYLIRKSVIQKLQARDEISKQKQLIKQVNHYKSTIHGKLCNFVIKLKVVIAAISVCKFNFLKKRQRYEI